MPHVLLISGSTRSGSSNTSLLRTVPSACPPGVTASLDERMTALPHFNPDDDGDHPPAPVVALRAAVAAADAVLFCTPEYAGSMPGTLKNLLEWTVGSTVMTGKPVAWVSAYPDERRGHGAISELETVLGYVQATLVADACATVPVARDAVTAEGTVSGDDVRDALAAVLAALTASTATEAAG